MSLGDVENNIDIIVRMLGAATAAAEAVKLAAATESIGGAAEKAAVGANTLSASFEKMAATGKSAQMMGSSLTRHLTIPIGLVGGAAVKMSLDYDKAMELIVTQSHAPQAELDAIHDKTMDVGAAFGQMPVDAAKAMYHIESTGLRGSAALDMLKVASMGAAVGQAKLDSTSYALSATIASGIDGVSNATQAMGVLNATVGAGDMHMDQLNGAISTGILPTAKTFGVTLQQVGGALATMADQGVAPTEAATRLRMSMSLLGAPSMQASKHLKMIGLDSLQLGRAMRDGGPIGAIDLLRSKLNDFSNDKSVQANLISRMFGGGKSSGTIMAMLGNLDRLDYGLKAKQTAVDAGTNKLGGDWQKTAQTDAQKLAKARADFEVSLTKMGSALRPTVIPLLEHLAHDVGSVADAFSKLTPTQQKTITDMALLVAVLGPGVKLSGMLLSTYGTMGKVLMKLVPAQAAVTEEQIAMDAAMTANPIGAIILAFVAMIGVVYEVQKHSKALKHDASDAFHAMGDAVRWAGDEFKGFGRDVKHVYEETLAPFKKMMSMADALGNGINPSKLGNMNPFGSVSSAIKKIPGLATGGTYTSPGLSLVGENGPEVRYEPSAGASIIPLPAMRGAASQTRGMDHAAIRQAILEGFASIPAPRNVVKVGNRVIAESTSAYAEDRRARR